MATELDTARHQYETYRFCYDNGHQQWLELARKCFEFWRGNQWDEAIKAQLEREGRPALTLNVIESLIRTMKGIQRALRNDVRFVPVQDASTESANVRDALWLHVQNQNALDFLESEIYEKGLIMARSFFDIRMNYDESIQGHVKISGRRSQDVLLDPSAETYDPDGWPLVITRRWVSYNDILHLYGKDKADAVGLTETPSWYDYEDIMMSQQMGHMPYYRQAMVGDVVLKAMRGHLSTELQRHVIKNKDVFIDTKTGDWSEIPEKWDRERVGKLLQVVPDLTTMRRNVKTIRWTTTCEDVVLHDEDSPYNHFTIVPYFPAWVDGVSKGAAESLLDPQMLYNKMTSNELHIISTTANSGYKLKRGSLKNMTVEELEVNGAKSGFVAELDNVEDLEKIQPNQTPQGHDRLSFKADQIMRSLSGVSDQARGFAREDVAGEAILANQAAQDINFAGYLANLHRSKQLVARNVMDCIQSHYTETRVIMVNRGSVYAPEMQEVTINQPTPEGAVLNDVTRGKYSTVMIPAPSRTTLSEADFALLLKLRTEVGVAIPDTMLIELSPASNKAQIIQGLAGGPDSNERQRKAEELALEQQEIDKNKAAAAVRKDMSAAALNESRAEKFAIEAASDPDASYERVETARIQAEAAETAAARAQKAREHADRLALDTRKADDQKEFQNRQLALNLAELDIEREERSADREVAKQENRSAKRRDKKPGSK